MVVAVVVALCAGPTCSPVAGSVGTAVVLFVVVVCVWAGVPVVPGTAVVVLLVVVVCVAVGRLLGGGRGGLLSGLGLRDRGARQSERDQRRRVAFNSLHDDLQSDGVWD